MIESFWRILAKSLGTKDGKDDKESDYIACVRLLFILLCVGTNITIIAGVIHHW